MKKKDFRKELSRFQIHTKTGREAFLSEVAKWWEALYPAKADFFKAALRQLREVTNPGGAYDTKRGEFRCTLRVPQELWCFIRSWLPDFGNDSADIELLRHVWCDLVRPAKDRRRRMTLSIKKPEGYQS